MIGWSASAVPGGIRAADAWHGSRAGAACGARRSMAWSSASRCRCCCTRRTGSATAVQRAGRTWTWSSAALLVNACGLPRSLRRTREGSKARAQHLLAYLYDNICCLSIRSSDQPQCTQSASLKGICCLFQAVACGRQALQTTEMARTLCSFRWTVPGTGSSSQGATCE